MNDKEITSILTACKVVREGHFVGTSGKHLDRYFDKNKLLAYPDAMERLAKELARRYVVSNNNIIDVVVSPELADAFIGQRVAYYLGRFQDRLVHFVIAEKDLGTFKIGRGQEAFMTPGANALIVVDVLTTGGSSKSVAELVEAFKVDIVAAAALCDRGGVTPAMMGLSEQAPLYVLTQFDWPSWAANEEDPCPLCRDHIRFNTEVGHGEKYLEALTAEGLFAPWMTAA